MAWLNDLVKLTAYKWLLGFYECGKILSILAPKFVTVAKKVSFTRMSFVEEKWNL